MLALRTLVLEIIIASKQCPRDSEIYCSQAKKAVGEAKIALDVFAA